MSRLYRTLARGLGPPLRLWLKHRAGKGKEDPARLSERRGVTCLPRPPGRLVWIHGASVGEARSVLPLLARILETYPDAHALVTTGTLTSAEMLRGALPRRALHQFVPLDVPRWIGSFLDHWRPDAALWIESELWPNLLDALAARGVPSALVNARLSPASFARWQRSLSLLRPPLAAFSIVLAQSRGDAERLAALGARDARCVGNIKFDAPQLGADIEALADLGMAIGDRPLWLAASTHPGEEEIVAAAHLAIAAKLPRALTLLVPRHAVRGDEIAAMLRARGLRVAQRSARETIGDGVQIYLADTMGELGLFYRLAPIAFIGKSLQGEGGQNPLEAAALDTAILSGPRVSNFTEIFASLVEAGGARLVADGAALADAVVSLTEDPASRQRMAQAALDIAVSGRGAVERVFEALRPVLASLGSAAGDARS